MDTYKVVIVDDDELSLDTLRSELQSDGRFVVTGCARNGKQAQKMIVRDEPDLLFLDIELPDMTGMELLQSVRSQGNGAMRVVFYTAYDKYMIQAIREAAFDYLLKPITRDDLQVVIDRFLSQAAGVPIPSMQTLQGTPRHPNQTFLIYTPTNDMRALRPAEIGYFRYCSNRKQWEVILNNNQQPLALRRGIAAEQILQYASCFVQIHQSYIINIDYLMIIRDGVCVLYPPFDKVTELQVSRKFKRELQDRFCL